MRSRGITRSSIMGVILCYVVPLGLLFKTAEQWRAHAECGMIRFSFLNKSSRKTMEDGLVDLTESSHLCEQ